MRLAANGAAAGALLGALIAFAIPIRYSAHAVLRIRPNGDGPVSAAALADYLRQEISVLQSVATLSEFARDHGLYPGLTQNGSSVQAGERMRSDLHIDPWQPEDPASAFRVAFEYEDRYKAHEAVSAVVGHMMTSTAMYLRNIEDPPRLEVLSAARSIQYPQKRSGMSPQGPSGVRTRPAMLHLSGPDDWAAFNLPAS